MEFIKLSATGNDFIVINNFDLTYNAGDIDLWKKLCERRKNIGADGVLLVEPSQGYDFKMRYINADGGEVSMCGNGGRAITYFYYTYIDSSKKDIVFETMNGVYNSFVESENLIMLEMTELSELDQIDISSLFLAEKSLYLNTGVPHCVYETKTIDHLDIKTVGRNIRFNSLFKDGTNINFYEPIGKNKVKVRTYERGVEDETLSCGTGITAVAIACKTFYNWNDHVEIVAKGGDLTVKFDKNHIYLVGEVNEIFSGICSL